MPYGDDTEQYNEIDRLKRQEQNNHDLQNEIAGRNVGRQKRFMVSGDSTTLQQEKKERDQFHTLTALELLLQDPEYQVLYQETSKLVINAALATEVALEQATMQLQTLQDTQKEQLENANRLADGTAVFGDAYGDVYTQNGDMVKDRVALDGIVWRDNATTYEEFQANQDAIEKTNGDIEALTRYQIDVIGAAKESLEDEDNPLSKEELEQVKKDVIEQAPEIVREAIQPPESDNTLNLGQPPSSEMAILKF